MFSKSILSVLMRLPSSFAIDSTHFMQRNTTVDFARLLAAYGVIALHVPTSTIGAHWLNVVFWPLCVPFFYIISLVYFVAGLAKAKSSTKGILARVWRRLVLPYLAWTAIYTSLLIVKTLLVHGTREFIWWRILLYGESAVQLYFLPTLLLLQSLAMALYLLLRGGKAKRATGGLLLMGGLLYLGWGIYQHCFGVATVGNLAGISIYLVAAFWLAPATENSRPSASYLVLGGICTLGAIFCNASGYIGLLGGYPLILPLGGLGMLLLTLGFPALRLAPWLTKLAAASFGIYLCHVLFLEAIELLLERLYPALVVYNFPVKLAEITFLFGAAAGFTFLLKRVPPARKLLLGES